MSDRTVHAECEGFSVVRYNRAGKWYVESVARGRSHVGVAEAARRACAAETLGGTIHFGLPGGGAFDRQVAAFFHLRTAPGVPDGSPETE